MTQDTEKIGDLLVQEGYLDATQKSAVLKIQKEYKDQDQYRPFGQICIEQNLIRSEELQRLLRKHKKRILLGELLINLGWLSVQQIEQALLQQKKRGLKLGRILVALKWLTEQQLVEALSLQLDIPRIIPSLEIADQDLLQQIPIEMLRKYSILPIHRLGDQISIVMEDPQDLKAIQVLQNHFKCKIAPAIASPLDLRNTIDEHDRIMSLPGLGPISLNDSVRFVGEEKPVTESLYESYTPITFQTLPAETSETTSGDQGTQIVHFLIKNALQDRASAIHIEPQEKHIRIRYRIDGVLHHKTDLPTDLGPLMIQRLKELCCLDPKNTETHQRGRIETKHQDKQLEFQLATYPSLWGENLMLSIQEKCSATQERLLNLDRLGFSPLCQQRYQNLLQQPGGLIVLTGPARSGKTATLYASINFLNQQNRSIITAENPIEMPVPGTIQGEYRPESHVSFAEKIKSMMYLDPDILMVSEIDAAETLEAVVDVALTGAKVISSYPAFDATGALLRMNRLGLENYLLATSNVSVLSQRLVRRLCQSCKQSHVPEQKTFNQLGLVDVSPTSYTYYKPVGCADCNHRGFVGQVAIHELLQINEAIREAILNHKSAATIRGIARTEAKLVSMAEDGLYKAIEGLTSVEEVQRVAFVNEYDAQTPWEAEEIYSICKGLETAFI